MNIIKIIREWIQDRKEKKEHEWTKNIYEWEGLEGGSLDGDFNVYQRQLYGCEALLEKLERGNAERKKKWRDEEIKRVKGQIRIIHPKKVKRDKEIKRWEGLRNLEEWKKGKEREYKKATKEPTFAEAVQKLDKSTEKLEKQIKGVCEIAEDIKNTPKPK